VVSTLISLFVSFTVTPMLASRFSKLEKLTKDTLLGKIAVGFEAQYDKFTVHYMALLKWSLSNRWKVAMIAIGLFVSSIALVAGGFVGGEFMTQSDRGEFAVTIEKDPGATLDESNFATQEIERIISQIPEVQKIFTNVGASNEGLIGQTSNNISQVNVTLVPKNQRVKSTEAVGREIREKTQGIAGVKLRINPVGIFGTADESPVMVIVSGSDRAEVQRSAQILVDSIRTIPGTADVRLSSEEGKPETRIEIDRDRMAALGLTLSDVGSTLRVAFTGDNNAKFREGDDEYDIRVMYDKFDRSNTTDVSKVTFKNKDGKLIELAQIARVYQTTGPTKLQRKDRNSAVTVMAQVIGRPIGSVGSDVGRVIASLYAKGIYTPGITTTYAGNLKNQSESVGTLGTAFLAGILFVYLIMIALYDSYVWPFVVLFSIPLAIVGALYALALTAKTLTIFSFLGIIMLVGLVAKNAILLVDFTNKLREEGSGVMEALTEAGRERLRPILMTTFTMIFGMMPIAISKASGSEWKSGLAWALIGGLTSSMFLTLILIPVVYVWFDKLRIVVPNFFFKLFGKTRDAQLGGMEHAPSVKLSKSGEALSPASADGHK
jgi:hydrophobic/amphiphilic exporter-1 (mainly G- bacteria), HAE1 family